MKKAYSTEGEIKIETKAAFLSLWGLPFEPGVQGLHPTVAGFSTPGWGAWCHNSQ